MSTMETPIRDALADLRQGKPVLVYDAGDREQETDILYAGDSVTHRDVAFLRNAAGGLVCVAISADTAKAFSLPFLQEVIDHPTSRYEELSYDDRSSFSIPVNHRSTDTGVTDRDRAYTIRRLAAAAGNHSEFDFDSEFRTPGHVNVLRAHEDLLSGRVGHTELGIALAEEAGATPAVVVCEMLEDTTGEAVPRERAGQFARDRDLTFLEGSTIVENLVQ